MKYSIGLDIGIASVGWSVIRDDNGFIEDLGVRLFEARNSDNNLERRNARGTRRLLRRRKTRLSDAQKYLASRGFDGLQDQANDNPYMLRVKGLTEKLTKDEIYRVILHILKKRGISYLDENDLEAKENGKEYSQEVRKNAILQKTKTPGEIQLERLKEKGRVRSGINQKGEYQLNIFTVDAYANELNRILNCQQAFHDEIDDEFKVFFLNKGTGEKAGLIYRKRPYYHGPGNAQNPSEYGRWATYPERGVPEANIFDKLIGTDITGERRAASISVSAQKYNFLNDINNLRLPRDPEYVTIEEKKELLGKLMTEEIKMFGPSQLSKHFGFSTKEIKGWRINKSEKEELHAMKVYRRWKEIFAENDINISEVSEPVLDKIAMIVTLNTDRDAVEKTIEIELPDISPKLKEVVAQNFQELKKNSSDATWHSFSLKTLSILIPELINTSEEQNTILERLGLKFDLRTKYANNETIPVTELLEEIYNPTVSKSVRQAIKVLNALVEKYGKENIGYVTIEMPRDKNEKDEKATISKIQKQNEERHKKSHQYFMQKSGWDEVRFNAEVRKSAFAKKLLYYYEQDGKCAYSGHPIQPHDLLTGATEIDHIIPLSISLDDSINNKVLVLAKANQEKGQRTPYQAFCEGAKLGQTWPEFVAWVNNNQAYKFNKHKKNWLLFEEDVFHPSIQKRFVARNLNDTRYSSRIVLNAVQSFFSQSETKVKVVTGSFTHTLRKKWQNVMEKTRDTHHHHAVDATLCAITPFVNIAPYEYKYDEEKNEKYMIDTDTGEVVSYAEYKK